MPSATYTVSNDSYGLWGTQSFARPSGRGVVCSRPDYWMKGARLPLARAGKSATTRAGRRAEHLLTAEPSRRSSPTCNWTAAPRSPSPPKGVIDELGSCRRPARLEPLRRPDPPARPHPGAVSARGHNGGPSSCLPVADLDVHSAPNRRPSCQARCAPSEPGFTRMRSSSGQRYCLGSRHSGIVGSP
jgi:hypothetical protein